VVVRPTTDIPEERFAVGAIVRTDAGAELEIVSVGPHRDGLLVRFRGIEGRDAAEALRGVTLVIPRTRRRRLDDGEFWPEELIGCVVVTVEGRRVGEVVDVVLGGAQDRLVVVTGEEHAEIPFVDALVPEVDVEERRIVVDLPEGLV